MSRPTQIYKNSTRLCITLNVRGVPVSATGLSLVLTRVGQGCTVPCRPCPKNVFECAVEDEEPETPEPTGVTLPLIELRPDGSLCALITSELSSLESGRYLAEVTGNEACKQCFKVDLLDGCPDVSSYSETPDGCLICETTSPPPAPAPAPGPAPYTITSDRPLWTH